MFWLWTCLQNFRLRVDRKSRSLGAVEICLNICRLAVFLQTRVLSHYLFDFFAILLLLGFSRAFSSSIFLVVSLTTVLFIDRYIF